MTNLKGNLYSNTKIVIIDDDQDILDLLVNFFKARGSTVTTFLSAEDALKKLSENPGDFYDIILTDLQLPKMNGIDFTIAAKQQKIETPIIVMTVTRSAEIAMRAIRNGAYDFIVKPIHFPQLQVSVERAFHLNNLKQDVSSLRSLVKGQTNLTSAGDGLIGRSPNFLKALDLAKRVAKSNANVFIHGESGTGKELVAKFIHNNSNRKKGAFVAINCSAIPENLLESVLFGHAKGSFTGAIDKKIGLFEEAENGTILLDEIGDLSLTLQAKLLRALQEKKIKRVGENQDRSVNARVVSATHKNLMDEVSKGNFREDLFFRLNVIPIYVPPLRERKEDILPLAEFFLKKYSALNESPARRFSREALQLLFEKKWQGNVRELENTIERAVVLCSTYEIQQIDLEVESPYAALPSASNKSNSEGFLLNEEGHLLTLHDLTQKYIEYALEKNNGAKDRTAKELGIDRKTLYRRLQLTH
jgi:two-component system response regulator HydG